LLGTEFIYLRLTIVVSAKPFVGLQQGNWVGALVSSRKPFAVSPSGTSL